jgi:hypothetical protein
MLINFEPSYPKLMHLESIPLILDFNTGKEGCSEDNPP